MGFGERIKKLILGRNDFPLDMQDELCNLLVEGDFGAHNAYKTVDALKDRLKKEDSKDILYVLYLILTEELQKAKKAGIPSGENDLTIILMLGVNGVGKTTTAAKLCDLYRTQFNKASILAAADTFRAAAIDQLKLHGEKLNMRVVAHKQGGDPAAVVFDAIEAAQSAKTGFVIADTAGRMHTKNALIEELKKIDRVVELKTGGKNYLKYLVLDATTGRNAFAQAEVFNEAVNLDGIILSKYDSTAKGGVVFSLASDLHLPAAYICTGEKYGDISLFNPEKFCKEFTGIE